MNQKFNFQFYFSEGFRIFGKNAGLYILFTLVFFVVSLLCGIVPGVSIVASLLVTNVLMAGVYIFVHLQETGNKTEFANFFDGFRNGNYLPLVLNGIFSTLLSLVASIPIIIVAGAALWAFIQSRGQDMEILRDLSETFIGTNIALLILGAILLLLVSLLLSFSMQNVLFKKMTAWDGIVASYHQLKSHIPMLILFYLAWGILLFLGACLCGIGLLVVLPAFVASLYAAYKDMVGVE